MQPEQDILQGVGVFARQRVIAIGCTFRLLPASSGGSGVHGSPGGTNGHQEVAGYVDVRQARGHMEVERQKKIHSRLSQLQGGSDGKGFRGVSVLCVLETLRHCLRAGHAPDRRSKPLMRCILKHWVRLGRVSTAHIFREIGSSYHSDTVTAAGRCPTIDTSSND